MQPVIAISVVEAAVLVTVIEVAAPPEIVAMVAVTALHIARTSTFAKYVAMVWALDMDTAIAVQPVMHIHAALGVMHITDLATRPSGYRGAVLGDMRIASLGR